MHYKSADWSLEIPEGWSHDEDGSCTIFARPNGVGAFRVSSFRKGEAVTDDDLREFAGEIPLVAVSLGHLTGFRTRSSEDNTLDEVVAESWPPDDSRHIQLPVG